MMPLTQSRKADLLAAVTREAWQNHQTDLPVYFDAPNLLVIISQLQLAQRHPGNRGPGAAQALQIIHGMIGLLRERGYAAHAELAELGFNPDFDE